MSSMKANIEHAAELLDVSVEALTEYMLDRDPELASIEHEQQDRVVDAAIALNMDPTILLLAVLDMVRVGGAVTAPPAMREIRDVIFSDVSRPAWERLSEIARILNRAGY